MNIPPDSVIPTILFGAFDRHNFGDLLFPHVAAALLPDHHLLFAGLFERDLRQYGGHQLTSLKRLITQMGNRQTDLMHVGGEILTCNAWQAAAMLLPPESAQKTIAWLERHPQQKLAWAQEQFGFRTLAPYCASRQLFPRLRRLIFHGVGGVGFDEQTPPLQAEVLATLRLADALSVRDRVTYDQLSHRGITAQLVPDPGVMVAELFGTHIAARRQQPEMSQILKAFPQGYLAVQFSADFGDDATLSAIARQLDQINRQTGLGIVFFRAGAAPWHDDLDCYRRTVARMDTATAVIFQSLHLWDICALIAGSSAYCGSSLHGRIIALAFALPRISLLHPTQSCRSSKQAAFASTWDLPDMCTVGVNAIASGIAKALTASTAMQRRMLARKLTTEYRQAFNNVRRMLAA